jgi:hypothetical protein
MERSAGPVMTLCPNCKSIQKTDSICTICKYPIPPKTIIPEDEKKEAGIRLMSVIKCLAPYRRFDENEYDEEENMEVDAPIQRPKILDKQRRAINMQLIKAGLDGNGRFASPTEGLTVAIEVLMHNGIELETISNNWALTKYDDFKMLLDVAWTTEGGPFSIQNTMLVFTWYKFTDEVFECLAYLS